MPLVLIAMMKKPKSSSNNCRARVLKNSLQRDPRNWPQCLPEVVVLLLVEQLLPVVPTLLLPRKRRKKSPKKNLMTIWDSGFSTKCFCALNFQIVLCTNSEKYRSQLYKKKNH